MREARALPGKNEAVREAHLPTDWPSLKAARRRLAFEELFFYQIALALLRADVRRGVSIPVDGARRMRSGRICLFRPRARRRACCAKSPATLPGERAMRAWCREMWLRQNRRGLWRDVAGGRPRLAMRHDGAHGNPCPPAL